MRIIKHGKDPKVGAHFKTKCRMCKTVFEWHTGESTLRPDPRDGNYYEVKCPVCGHLCTQDATIRWAG